jgi:hypothetical protein
MMATIRHAALVAVGVCAMSACVSVQSTRLGAGVIRPPVPPDQVAIYRTANQVHSQYEEVALLSAAGQYDWTNEEQMFKRMRKEAGALGANGIILDSITEPSTGAKVANALLLTPAQRTGKAVAIYIANTTASR